MWYDFIPRCMLIIGILLLVFGAWCIWKWNAYAKLLADIKELFEKPNI